ncbi:methyltransferase domain-containing protein [Amycolatopsis rhizosphaerae]|uniref:Methyltransferase domain-containing protein n=1 Tax=Amycolatopsis rhizosphaerae TaxID=2053003 RepID=A0A558DEB1_9PSEU|nr:methyltransferase domain-containing protein [Amycolatopsis rhizosphaerae]TVT59358.1 methyltransferase domain-containing protein [Amycolatopsis rhizosphaerae]
MARYTHGHHEAVLRSHAVRTAEDSAAYLLPHLRPGMALLDVGSGPGTITADLAALVAPGEVTALEPTREALALAERTAAERGAGNMRFDTGDVHSLPHPDGRFDVVHAHQVLQHVHDPVLALREMRRVRTADGVVAARDADYAAMTWYPEIPALDEWLSVYRRTARHNGGEPDAGRRLLSWARKAGFTDITASASVWCYATAEDRAWWGGLWADRILESAIAGQAVSYGYATRADLKRISEGWREWSEAPDGWFSVLHGEILCRG